MKSVLISVKPKYCEFIANGKKTIEVRKTEPKIKTPFKCYIYCTTKKHKNKYLHTSNKKNRLLFWHNKGDCKIVCQPENTMYTAYTCSGKVIGEFVCDEIQNRTLSNLLIKEDAEKVLHGSCLSSKEVLEYLGYTNGTSIFDCKHYGFYCWHISDLVIYDKPKDLSEFKKYNRNCWYADLGLAKRDCPECQNKECFVQRPPQSWCYVEEL